MEFLLEKFLFLLEKFLLEKFFLEKFFLEKLIDFSIFSIIIEYDVIYIFVVDCLVIGLDIFIFVGLLKLGFLCFEYLE